MTELENPLKPEVRKSPDTVTRTFRIDRNFDRKTDGLSSEGRVSMNQMANKALRRYVEWEVNAENFGTDTTTASTNRKFFDYLTIQQATAMENWKGGNQARGITTVRLKI